MQLTLTVPESYVNEWNAAIAANNPGKTAEQLKAISGKLVAGALLMELNRQKREASKTAASQQLAAGEFAVAVGEGQ